jgi:4-hydroxyphenylacetate 3-monooxygenase
MTYTDGDTGQTCAIGGKPPVTRQDWDAKQAAVETVFDDIGGVVTRVGDETVGEMRSLYDGQDVLNEIDPSFSANIRNHVRRAALLGPSTSRRTPTPRGPQQAPTRPGPDVLLRVVRETDNGIVVRGAKFETAAAYANQVFDKVTWPVSDLRADWHDDPISQLARRGRSGSRRRPPTSACPRPGRPARLWAPGR